MIAPHSSNDAQIGSGPAYEFTATFDPTRFCKAFYAALTANQTFTVHDDINDADVVFRVGGDWYPLRTQSEVTGMTGYSIVYAY